MSLPEARRLARHVAPELPASRLARQWAAVDARAVVGPDRRWLAAVAAIAVVAAAVVVMGLRRDRNPGAFAGAVLESGERESLTLPDGARVALAPASRVELVSVRAEGVEIRLQQGGVDLDVPHRPGHRLVVHAGAYDVFDVGTRFHVEVGDAERCTVFVTEGTVEIRAHDGSGEARRIGAGETWSSAPDATASNAGKRGAKSAPSSDEAPMALPTAADRPAVARPTGQPSAAPAGEPSAPSPAALLDTAKKARLAGRPRDAALALDTLRRRYRSDPRAGLAAFELGRLRLDSLGDAPGAVEALDDAIVLAPSGSFREDAEARRIDALDAEGAPGCAEARDVYLARYPRGIHATMVATRCRGR